MRGFRVDDQIWQDFQRYGTYGPLLRPFMPEEVLYRENTKARFYSLFIRLNRQENIMPALYRTRKDFNIDSQLDNASQVYNLLLPHFSIPIQIPFEELISFKQEPEIKPYLIVLRNWSNEITKSNITVLELQEKLEYLTSEYHSFMRIQKLKHSTSAIEIIFTAAAETIESLLKLKIGNAAKAMFNVRKSKIQLLEAELNAPGREIAFIIKSNERFGKDVKQLK